MRGGEIVDLPRRQRREAPRRVVIIGDVSGSMQRYSRMLLQFVHALTRRTRQVEAFVFSTRLTRITPWLIRDRSGRALDQVVGEVQDWGGGTRIGEALRAFNVHWARRVMRTGPVVIILSDGWDWGEPALSRPRTRPRQTPRPAADLAQPAAGGVGLRTADAWHASGPRARGRLHARAQSRKPRRAGQSPAGPPVGASAPVNERVAPLPGLTDGSHSYLHVQRTGGRCVESPDEPGCDRRVSSGVSRTPTDRRRPVRSDLVVGVAAVSGVFKMAIAVEDKTPETSYRLVVDGTGRPGFVRGRALVTLEPQDDRTIVHIAADANVGGLMARVGQRLLEGVARMTMDQFYGCLSAKISAYPPT